MSDEARLIAALHRIDGRSYPAYRDLKGAWVLGGFEFIVDHVQGDPFAAPSRVRVRTKSSVPQAFIEDCNARLAAEDWLLRTFSSGLVSQKCGSGRSGELTCLRPGPEVEERSAIRLFTDGMVEARFQLGLPAQGRRVRGRAAWTLIDEAVRDAAASLQGCTGLAEHVESVVFQRALRAAAVEQGLVAFVANGAILPRASGVDTAPLEGAVPFEAPPSLEVSLEVQGTSIRGMGIPGGVTAIVGGGFHGKSTLLHALQRGHLDHIPGDGRERVVAHPDTVKVRAEDGRRVSSVDVSTFLADLPGGRTTRPFSTDDASGSTSQAAAIVEAMEAGAKVLLVDEDTSATNLLVRDELMRSLIASDKEPISPFVEHVGALHAQFGISTVIVVGGVGDYLRVADTVVGMNAYRPEDLRAAVDALIGTDRLTQEPFQSPLARMIDVTSLAPGKIRARDERRLSYGREEVDLGAIEQILSGAHAWSIGQAIAKVYELCAEETPMEGLLDQLDMELGRQGIDMLSPRRAPEGGLIRPRRHEVAAAINRIRGLRVTHKPKDVRFGT